MAIAAGRWPECRWELADRPQGVPLEVGGPPARDSIFQRADQDTRDTQDTQDRADAWCEALPMHRSIAGAKRFQCTVVGVLGVPGVLAKALVPRSGQAPTSATGLRISALSHAPVNRRREALSMYRPRCLGCPGCPGQGTGPAKRPSAYPGLRPAPFIPSRLELADRPQGISFSSGRARTPGTPRTPKTWLAKCLRTWHARKPACHRPATN